MIEYNNRWAFSDLDTVTDQSSKKDLNDLGKSVKDWSWGLLAPVAKGIRSVSAGEQNLIALYKLAFTSTGHIDVVGTLPINGGVSVSGGLSAAGGLTGNLLGNVTGNLTGNVTGNVTGDLTGNVIQNGWSDVTLPSGFTHGTPRLQQRRNRDGTAEVCGQITGPFAAPTTGVPNFATLANTAAPGIQYIPASADGGPPAFIIVVGSALQFYPTTILPSGTYTLRLNGRYRLV